MPHASTGNNKRGRKQRTVPFIDVMQGTRGTPNSVELTAESNVTQQSGGSKEKTDFAMLSSLSSVMCQEHEVVSVQLTFQKNPISNKNQINACSTFLFVAILHGRWCGSGG